jgi:hypothetical protein
MAPMSLRHSASDSSYRKGSVARVSRSKCVSKCVLFVVRRNVHRDLDRRCSRDGALPKVVLLAQAMSTAMQVSLILLILHMRWCSPYTPPVVAGVAVAMMAIAESCLTAANAVSLPAGIV